MTTFAGWLADQNTRQDAVGEVARLWAQISPGRTHSVVGVTKALNEHADREKLAWVPEAVAATAEEYRIWKVNPEGASIAAPATRSQLDRIEYMLARVIDALGIPMLAEVSDDTELAAMHEFRAAGTALPAAEVEQHYHAATAMVPRIGPNGLEHVEAGSRIELPDMPMKDGKPDWSVLYGYADHGMPLDAELGEQAE